MADGFNAAFFSNLGWKPCNRLFKYYAFSTGAFAHQKEKNITLPFGLCADGIFYYDNSSGDGCSTKSVLQAIYNGNRQGCIYRIFQRNLWLAGCSVGHCYAAGSYAGVFYTTHLHETIRQKDLVAFIYKLGHILWYTLCSLLWHGLFWRGTYCQYKLAHLYVSLCSKCVLHWSVSCAKCDTNQ